MFLRRRFESAPNGAVRVRLPRRERELLRRLASELRGALEDDLDAPGLERLFPVAYEDPESQAEFRELLGDELRDQKLAAVDVLDASVEADRLDAEQADAWLRALNDARLVLGTRLDVQEDTFARGLDRGDPRAQELAVYGYLTWLQEQLVEAIG